MRKVYRAFVFSGLIVMSGIALAGDGADFLRVLCMPSINSLVIDSVSLWDGNDWRRMESGPIGHDLFNINGGEHVEVTCSISDENYLIEAKRSEAAYTPIRVSITSENKLVINNAAFGYQSGSPYVMSITIMPPGNIRLCGLKGAPPSMGTTIKCLDKEVKHAPAQGYSPFEILSNAFK